MAPEGGIHGGAPSPARPARGDGPGGVPSPTPEAGRPARTTDAGGRGRRAGGFTLLEVMVALVVAGMALGLLFRGSAAGLRTAAAAGQAEEALSLARSRLDALGRDGGLAPGDAEGEDGGFLWHSRVVLVATAPAGADRTLPRPALFALEVSVAAKGGPGVRLRTERLGTAPPEPP